MPAELLPEKCGVFGIYGAKNAAELTYLGLYALQHRGQESSGIVSNFNGKLHIRKGMGQVNDVFSKESLSELPGHLAIGHNRYSTTGANSVTNIQPFLFHYKGKSIAVGHNGNLTNTLSLRKKLEDAGAIFQSTTDTELILHLVAHSKKNDPIEKIIDALQQCEGAYSLTFITNEAIVAARDPKGFRPMALGKIDSAYVVASETCAFDIIGAEYLREVEPGEALVIDEKGPKSYFPFEKQEHAFCIFEFIYFARPDSMIYGENVDKVRRRLGRQLAIEKPVEADIVIAVPDSSNTAALGFSEQSGIKLEIGFIRNHYVGRTFIHPEQAIRDLDVRIKFNPVKGVLKDKRVVIVDDSIVRGTTSKKLVGMVRDAGAKEVHFRVSAPPIISPCFYGIDMPTKEELIGSSRTVEEIRKYLGADSLGYLSIEGMLSMPSLPKESFCVACFSGKYPTKIEYQGKDVLEKKDRRPAEIWP
ncbi:MAG: amidophosphoribosyltransferase [candidate division Zixibacteria bacterium]|nr:amidophosphoribosyltransferase [candidate division Zixibacteria bacterium]MCI0596861.1 amidophosphoribosyltransferase [candidate division Zixibacteria bacterium]